MKTYFQFLSSFYIERESPTLYKRGRKAEIGLFAPIKIFSHRDLSSQKYSRAFILQTPVLEPAGAAARVKNKEIERLSCPIPFLIPKYILNRSPRTNITPRVR